MYAPAGHGEVRAETVSKAWDWPGSPCNAAMEEGGGEFFFFFFKTGSVQHICELY